MATDWSGVAWFVRHDSTLAVAPNGLAFAAACLTRTCHGQDAEGVDTAMARVGQVLLDALGIARSGRRF